MTVQGPDALARGFPRDNAPRTAALTIAIVFSLMTFLFMNLVFLIEDHRRGQNVLNSFQNLLFKEPLSMDWLQG